MTPFRKPSTVKGTLLALLLPSGIFLMAAAWLVHGFLLERMSRDFVESRLKDEVAFLEHQIRQSGGEIDALLTENYFHDDFYHSFAIQSPTQSIVFPHTLAALLSPLFQSEQQGAIRVRGASASNAPSDLLAFRKSFLVNNTRLVVIVSEDMAALQASQAEFHAWTAIVSILLILLLVGVIWLGITLSMKPIVSLQASLKKLQDGEISRISVHAPEEFRPLVKQLNQLLDFLDRRLERSRDALANLSHSVKTPIAAVRQILDDTSRPLGDDLRREMGSRLGDIDKQLEAEMRRSRFAGPQVGKSAYPVKQARELLWLLGRLYPEKSFELSTQLVEERRWPIEEQDLSEIIGNLLDNAGKWSSTCVELSLSEANEHMIIVVGDDGPGVEQDTVGELGKRGLRLDEQTPGHGLGLAIVCDIVDRYSGQTNFSHSHLGGLKVDVSFLRPN